MVAFLTEMMVKDQNLLQFCGWIDQNLLEFNSSGKTKTHILVFQNFFLKVWTKPAVKDGML